MCKAVCLISRPFNEWIDNDHYWAYIHISRAITSNMTYTITVLPPWQINKPNKRYVFGSVGWFVCLSVGL